MSPAVADAKVAGRVQGLQSHFSDLTLRDGRNLAIELGGITPTPSLNRGIEESSSVSVSVYDPDLRLLDLTLLAEKWDASLDDLHFRYLGTKKQGKNFSIALEDRDVALLRGLEGPKKALRDKVTRAEFVKSLVEEVRPRLDFYCPQLHVKQPIEKKAQAKKAQAEAKENRGKGIGDAKHLTVDSAAASAPQKELGHTALQIAESVGAPFIVQVALIAALIDESRMGETAPGNVLQALGSGGAPVGSAEEEISGFLTGKPKWTGTTAMGYHREHPEATYYEIAQEVQASGAGASTRGKANYGQFGDEAREWVEAFGGEAGEDTGTTTVVEPYTFEVGKKETYWDAIQRLAKEVNWRAFVVAGRFFFIDELELARGMVRLAIKRKPGESKPRNAGIEDVDFDYNKNKPATEVTVTAFADAWKVPPGAVVTLEGYGPASIGFGDAPAEAGKGPHVGLSSNRNAKTGVGRARYIVSKISSPLGGSPGTRLITIILKKPTAPLPEKAASTESVAGASGNAPGAVAKMIAECDRIDAKHYPYSTPGARGTPPPASGPYDCSGVTSRIVYVGTGEPSTTMASAELAQAFEPGEGEWLTIYAKGPDGPSGHAFIGIKTPSGWRKFGTSSTNPGGGAGWIDDSAFSASYLAEFQKRHPKGL